MPAIKALTFDLDGTLWDVWPVVERAEQLLHEWLGESYPRIAAQFAPLELRGLCDVVSATHPERAHDRTWLRKAALQYAAQQAGYQTFDVEGAFAVFFSARNAVELFPEVRSTLEQLGKRYPLAALSNGNADLQIIGIHDLFKFYMNAIAFGAGKPNAAFFAAASQRLGVAPAHIVHIGDDPRDDVCGAAQAGFSTVWVNRNGETWPMTAVRADAEIVALDELEPLLAQWVSSGSR